MNPGKPVEEPRGTLLLIDDDAELLRIHEKILMRAGYLVEVASDGLQGSEKLRHKHYDAIVTDISMPGMSGVELLQKIRETDLNVPVILVTANPTVETAVIAVQHGAFQYMVKPVAPEALADVAHRAVRIGALVKQRESAAHELGQDFQAPVDRAGLEICFNRAVEKMWMAYQPIVNAAQKKIIAYEALLRTQETTLPFAGSFLRAAERLGRMQELGRRVREQVASTMATMEGDAQMFVNLHADELLDDSLYSPSATLTQFSRRIVLEVTERASLDGVPDIKTRVAKLRDLGYRIAVDDLGAGYAGLTSFALLEPDVVKIDMSLVRDIHLEVVKQKLVRNVVALGHDAGPLVVAEGVAAREEAVTLLGLGCDIHQGYLYAHPAKPFAEVTW